MPSPDGSFNLSGRVYGGSATSIGNLMVADGTGFYVVATSANRALYGRAQAIATSNWGGAQSGVVSLQFVGTCDSNLPNVGAGAADRWVRCSTAGAFEVFTPANAGTSDIVGKANANGVVTLQPGVWTETMAYNSVNGGTSGLPALPTAVGSYMLGVAAGPVYSWVSSAFDPSSVALTGYWKDYAGAPWLGSASAGPSNARSLATGTAPTVGAAFGVHPSALFNGTSQSLTSSTLAYDSYMSAAGYLIEVEFSLTSVAAPGATPIQDQALVTDNQGNIYLGVSTSGIRCGHYDGGYKTTGFIPCSTGVKHCAQMFYDGTTISLRLDGGTPVTIAAGAMQSQSICSPRIGANWNATAFLAGNIGRVLMAASPLTSTMRDQLRADAQTNYGTT